MGALAFVGAFVLAGCGKSAGADSGAQPAVAQATQAAGGLADGEYDCGGGYSFHAMGQVDVKGGTFRYRPFGDVVNGFAPYAVDADGTIHWGGKFTGLDDAPSKVVDAKKETWGFNVRYQATPSSYIDTMSCHKK